MARRYSDRLSGCCGDGRGDVIAGGGEVEEGDGEVFRHLTTSHLPLALSREVVAEDVLDELAGGGEGQRLSLVGPILKLDEAGGLGACGVEAAEFGEFLDGARWIEGPEARLQNFHRKGAEFAAGGLRVAPHVFEGA